MAPRSRTGCMTCRQRKLKCDEQRPVCGQCIKARRECMPSSGITFRHQQNPSMNGPDVGQSGGGLKSFYGYKETFNQGTTWVPVPRDLSFVHTTNPYEDAEDGPGGTGGFAAANDSPSLMADDNSVYSGLVQAAQAAYPAYATHGLEALSAVASQDYSYAPPPAPMSDSQDASHLSHTHMSPSPHDQTSSSQNLDFILNPSGAAPEGASSDGNIDPRLHHHHTQAQDFAGDDADALVSTALSSSVPASLEEELRMRIQS